MICPVCGEPFDHRASSHQGPECDRCSEEKMSGNISRLQDMTDDAISREAAVAALEHLYTLPISCAEVELAIDAIRALPAAGPAPQPTVPPEVKLALRVLLHHVEPGWDNCKTVVQLWLDSVPAPLTEAAIAAIRALPSAPAPLPWTEGALISALTRTEMNRYQAERVALIVLAGPGGKP